VDTIKKPSRIGASCFRSGISILQLKCAHFQKFSFFLSSWRIDYTPTVSILTDRLYKKRRKKSTFCIMMRQCANLTRHPVFFLSTKSFFVVFCFEHNYFTYGDNGEHAHATWHNNYIWAFCVLFGLNRYPRHDTRYIPRWEQRDAHRLHNVWFYWGWYINIMLERSSLCVVRLEYFTPHRLCSGLCVWYASSTLLKQISTSYDILISFSRMPHGLKHSHTHEFTQKYPTHTDNRDWKPN